MMMNKTENVKIQHIECWKCFKINGIDVNKKSDFICNYCDKVNYIDREVKYVGNPF